MGTLSDAVKAQKAQRRYARIPAGVCSDPELKDSDVRVYAALALLERGGQVNSGVRWIGECCNLSRSEVSRSIARLLGRGHVMADIPTRGKRKSYRLSSVVFAKTGGSTVAPKQTEIAPEKSQPVEIKCSACGATCKRVGVAGMCRTCVQDPAAPRLVRAARAELGSGATPDQMAVYLKMRRLAGKIKRILEAA